MKTESIAAQPMATGAIVIVAARASHVADVRGRLRRQDRDEILAATGLAPEDALEQSLARAVLAWAAVEQGRTVALFGVGAAPLPGCGIPWLLGTDRLVSAARDVVLHSRRYVARMRERFPLLANMVDARNRVALRWLRWCGFCIGQARPFGPFGLPFHPFHMGGAHVR